MEETPVIPIDNKSKDESPTANMTVEARKIFWTGVLFQLVDSPRFLAFLDSNYSIGIFKDDALKTVEVQVVEKPVVVGPPLSNDQIFKMRVACMQCGIHDDSKLLNRIMKILGQEETSSIIMPNEDIRKGVDHEMLKSKLDV